jgi:hypothetical protein
MDERGTSSTPTPVRRTGGVAAARERCEALSQSFEHRLRRKQAHLHGSELDCKGQAVQALAEREDRIAVPVRERERRICCTSPLDEERNCVGVFDFLSVNRVRWQTKRLKWELSLPLQLEERTARDEGGHAVALFEQPRKVGRRGKNLLEVVEYEQQLGVSQALDDRVERRARTSREPQAAAGSLGRRVRERRSR